MNVFRAVMGILFPPRVEEALVNSLSEDTVFLLLQPKEIHGVMTLCNYHDERIRAIVWEAKYHKNEKALTMMGNAFTAELPPATGTLIVPIPLAPKRQIERGYNQVEEALLRAGFTVLPALVRVRDTVPQTQLARSLRLTNLAGAFSVPQEMLPMVRGAHILLIDDVTTTGATLREAQNALRAAGAETIDCFAFARS